MLCVRIEAAAMLGGPLQVRPCRVAPPRSSGNPSPIPLLAKPCNARADRANDGAGHLKAGEASELRVVSP
jgi:hypothetical protein